MPILQGNMVTVGSAQLVLPESTVVPEFNIFGVTVRVVCKRRRVGWTTAPLESLRYHS